MKKDSGSSLFNEKSLIGIAVTAVLSVLVGWVSAAAQLPEYLTSGLTAVAVALPGAIVYGRARRSRDRRADLERLRRGEFVRSVPLAVLLFAAATVGLDSAIGFVLGALGLVDALSSIVALALECVALFFIAWRAGHYFGSRPYAATVVASLVALGLRVLIGVAAIAAGGAVSVYVWGDMPVLLLLWTVSHLLFCLVSLAGVALARRTQRSFVARVARRSAERREVRMEARSDGVSQTPPDLRPQRGPLPPPRAEDRRLD